jgi:hypothetical protein
VKWRSVVRTLKSMGFQYVSFNDGVFKCLESKLESKDTIFEIYAVPYIVGFRIYTESLDVVARYAPKLIEYTRQLLELLLQRKEVRVWLSIDAKWLPWLGIPEDQSIRYYEVHLYVDGKYPDHVVDTVIKLLELVKNEKTEPVKCEKIVDFLEKHRDAA